jgi:thymidylate synthase (FAD)
MSDTVKCLDHGFVRLVDVMGDDSSIVEAARLSISGEGVRPVSEDRALIRYLMRHRHTSPFEFVVFKFDIKLPIFVARQMVRHRCSSINEMSARYSELPNEYYVPEPEHIQVQADKNKQGRGDNLAEDAEDWPQRFKDESEDAFELYGYRLRHMAKEIARINLPLSTYTRWYWKQDLHNLLHFLSLRLDPHAQYEIRVFAEAMASFVKARCPLTWEAFEDFRLNAMSFSVDELKALRQFFSASFAQEQVNLMVDWKTKRESDEFVEKLRKLLGAQVSNDVK